MVSCPRTVSRTVTHNAEPGCRQELKTALKCSDFLTFFVKFRTFLTILTMSLRHTWVVANGGLRTLLDSLQRYVSLGVIVVAAGFVLLTIGFLVGSFPLQTVGILVFMGTVVFAYLHRRTRSDPSSDPEHPDADGEVTPTAPDTYMKTLIFDDFQRATGNFRVGETEDAAPVIPSTKSARPVVKNVASNGLGSLEIPDFFDFDADAPYAEVEPRNEFHSLLNKVLLVLKDVLFAHTVAFFWANTEKREMVLEAMTTDSQVFMPGRRFPMDQDLVSAVATTGKPQILGRLSATAQQDTLRYYSDPPGVSSVMCVPVFYAQPGSEVAPIAVIAADSRLEDQFGNETLVLVGRFTKLISSLIKSYIDKYDLLLDAELIASIRRMHDRIGNAPTEEGILNCLVDETGKLCAWDFLTVVMYNEEHRGWVVQRSVNKRNVPYVGMGLTIEPNGTVVGQTISANAVRTIETLGEGGVVRFHPSEPPALTGSFLCVPISSFNRCYGALTVESQTPGQFRGSESEKMYRLVQNASAALEVVYMNDTLHEQMPVDPLTGAMTEKFFRRKFQEEAQRAMDLSLELSYAVVSIDNFADHVVKYGREGGDAALAALAGVFRTGLKIYDALGRIEDDTFGVLLVNTVANEAYLWAEKIRKQMASHVISIEGTTFSVTVSIGVSGLMDGMNADDLSVGSVRVHERAVDHGGNLVRVQ